MKKFFSKQDYVDAEIILAQLSVKTNCFDARGKVIPAKYLVCVDDDITSAFYAVDIYFQIHHAYGYYPTILCVGGVGPLSKYTNKSGESEGQKLARVCEALGVMSSQLMILDKGTNTGLNCLDIYNVVKNDNEWKVIMCLTKRLSLRLKQTFEFLDKQYPDKVDAKSLAKIVASTFYYVPDEALNDMGMMQVYNCKGICKGVLLFSEIASIYDRISRYSGKLQKPLDFVVSSDVKAASKRLAKKYPLKINMYCFNGIWQFVWVYLYILRKKKYIQEDTQRKFVAWRFFLENCRK